MYVIAWILKCDHWFHGMFLRHSSDCERMILEKSKKIVKCRKTNVNVRIMYYSFAWFGFLCLMAYQPLKVI